MVLELFVQYPALGIVAISFTLSVVISLIYKLTIDQKETTKNRAKMKELSEKIKKLSKSGKQKEAMELQKKISEMSLKQMRSTFKPMLITFVVVIPVFLMVLPGLYGVNVDVVGGAFTLERPDPVVLDENGTGTFSYRGETHDVTYTIQDEGRVFDSGGYTFEFGKYSSRSNELTVKRVVAESPVHIPFAGKEIGWLGWYILTSIPFSLITRKLMGVV